MSSTLNKDQTWLGPVGTVGQLEDLAVNLSCLLNLKCLWQLAPVCNYTEEAWMCKGENCALLNTVHCLKLWPS